MKILITSAIWPPEIGGPATYAEELVQRLKNQHDIKVAVFADGPEKIEGIELVSVSKKSPLLIRQIRYLKTILTLTRKADLTYAQNAMAAGVPSVIASKLSHKPLIIKFVGDNAWESAFRDGKTKKLLEDFLQKPDAGIKNRIRQWFQKWTLSKANKVIVPSNYLGRVLSKYYKIKPNKIITIYNASESNNSGSEEITPDPNQIITVARLVPWKGIDGIIKAVKIIKQTRPEIKLVVAGDGPEMNNLKKLVEELSLGKSVEFLGNVSKKEVMRWYKRSFIFILNSSYEGLPHTVLDSFAAGTPVIATNILGTNEAVYNESTGLAVPLNDPQSIASAANRLFNNSELRSQLIVNARRLLKEKFSWQSHLSSLNGLFKSLVFKSSNQPDS